jgi:hypothetical protein
MTKRMTMLQDILAILAEYDLNDACVVVRILNEMRSYDQLKPLWRASELPTTARVNLAEDHGT